MPECAKAYLQQHGFYNFKIFPREDPGPMISGKGEGKGKEGKEVKSANGKGEERGWREGLID